MPAQIFTVAERPDLYERFDEIGDPWPEFIHHDEVVTRLWPRLYEAFPHFQIALVDESGALVGKANSIPISWSGDLPGGVDEALEQGLAPGGKPDVACALVAIVDPEHLGRGLSQLLLDGMRTVASRAGLAALVAPVRPIWKDRYPLIPIERYMHWRREDGLPFDPWIRVHDRLGAAILGVAQRSLDISGSVAEWEAWTSMSFPQDGDYVVPGALVPVRFEDGVGRYVEPNVWMRHELR